MNEQSHEQLKEYLDRRRAEVDEALDRFVPGSDSYPPALFEAARYSLFAGGKRLRPILCMAAAEAVGGTADDVMPCACALEMIHTYSLIHDDLPAMDNDDFRRGKQTNHKVFGEGMAVLAGDALLTDAFRLLAGMFSTGVHHQNLLRAIHEIAEKAGFFGMIAGQAVDLDSEGKKIVPETLHYIHMHKTAALITVSLRAGAILADAPPERLEALTAYGENIGLAFQIVDDILNVKGDPAVMGKGTGSDGVRGKATYPALFGLEEAEKTARRLVKEALSKLEEFGDDARPLRLIAQYIIERES